MKCHVGIEIKGWALKVNKRKCHHWLSHMRFHLDILDVLWERDSHVWSVHCGLNVSWTLIMSEAVNIAEAPSLHWLCPFYRVCLCALGVYTQSSNIFVPAMIIFQHIFVGPDINIIYCICFFVGSDWFILMCDRFIKNSNLCLMCWNSVCHVGSRKRFLP